MAGIRHKKINRVSGLANVQIGLVCLNLQNVFENAYIVDASVALLHVWSRRWIHRSPFIHGPQIRQCPSHTL